MKTLLKNGLIVDGNNTKPYIGNVLIENDFIIAIGNIDIDDVDNIIELNGLTVAPGFIDTHSHSDLEILSQPEVLPKIMQGITTEILGILSILFQFLFSYFDFFFAISD